MMSGSPLSHNITVFCHQGVQVVVLEALSDPKNLPRNGTDEIGHQGTRKERAEKFQKLCIK
jgi:hypothetical protein